MANSKHHIATLDGLRGVAALDVMAYHGTFGTTLHQYVSRGYLAVDFFFVLSGYVIARAYEARLESGWPKRAFFRTRAIRLYPMIVFGMALGLAGKCFTLVHVGHAAAGSGIPGYSSLFIAFGLGLLLIPDPGVYGLSNALFPLDLVLWSLLLEVIANVAYPFALQRKSWLTHAVLGISAVVMVAATAFYGTANFGWTFANIWPALARIGFSFSMGILVYRFSASPLIARLPSVSGIVLAIVILAAFTPQPFAAGWLYDIFAIFFLFPLVVALGTKARLPQPIVPAAMLLGAISYPLYVLHGPIVDHLWSVRSSWGLALSFSAIAVLSYLVLKFYDEPVRRFLEKRSAPSLAKSPTAAASFAQDVTGT